MGMPSLEWFAAEYGIAIAALDPERPASPEVLASISPATCRKHRLVPVVLAGGVLAIAMADPSDIFAIDRIASETGHGPGAVDGPWRVPGGVLEVWVAAALVDAPLERWYR
jgi:hypothetical protein